MHYKKHYDEILLPEVIKKKIRDDHETNVIEMRI